MSSHASTETGPPPATRLTWSQIARIAAGVLLVAYSYVMAVAVPVPYIKIQPGAAENVIGLMSVDGTEKYQPEGSLLFLTVSLSPRLTPLRAVLAWFDEDVELVEEEEFTGDKSREEVRQENLRLMEQSKFSAITVALEHLGFDVETVGAGAFVSDVLPDHPAAGKLRSGDVIVGVDGQPVSFASNAIELVRAREPGDTVELTIERGDEEETVQVETVEATAEGELVPQIGVQLIDNLEPDFPIDIEIDTGRVGGPSAGLAFTLAVLDELTPGELTGGRIVAVTGAIDIDGNVVRVGGVTQKTVAARQAGAVMMLVPAAEVDDAQDVAGDMEVVGIANLDDALEALARLGGNATALPRDLGEQVATEPDPSVTSQAGP